MKKELPDICFIDVNDNESVFDKTLKYLIEVKNPYNFKVNGTKVKISFSSKKNLPDIETALVNIALNYKN